MFQYIEKVNFVESFINWVKLLYNEIRIVTNKGESMRLSDTKRLKTRMPAIISALQNVYRIISTLHK
jgi:hypothetical protein